MNLENTERNIVVSVVGIMASVGLLLYLLILPALFSVFRSSHHTFYLLMISLAIPEIFWLILTLIYSIPSIVVGVDLFGTAVEQIMGYIDTIVYFMQLTHLFFISINRLRFVMKQTLETFDKVFTTRKIVVWCCLLWLFSIGNGILLPATSCVKFMNYYYWSMQCTNTTAANVGTAINAGLSNFFPVASVLIYIVMWLIIHKRKHKISENNQHPWKKNLSLIVQFSLVTLCMIGESSAYWILPRFLHPAPMSAVAHILAVACCSVNPYIYLFFNENIRRCTLAWFGYKSATVQPSVSVNTRKTLSHPPDH